MEVAQIHQDQLPRIKENIKRSHDYFKDNYDRFNEFRRFVFESSLRPEDITLLMTLSKPQLEFNILEAYISRLLGEFSKQEPSIEVSADDESQADPNVIKVVEAHLMHMFFDSKNHHANYDVYKDLLSGGFSVFKVKTNYANPMSFEQVIEYDRVFDPTLCGFDELARLSHKGDGRFCYELFPMAKDDFIKEHPDIPIGDINFRRDLAGFNWSYLNDATPILLIADYYEKKKRRVKIVQLVNGKVMTQKDYDKLLVEWSDIQQPPAIKGKPRYTELETIVRYRLIENQIIEYTEMDFSMFPLVFVDGNSILLKTPKNGNVRQLCRPYAYQAKGAQRLKNFAGITLANGIENIVQHRFKVAKEALPKEENWLQAYKDIQKPATLIYNAFYENDPEKALPPPQEIQNVPLPQEVIAGFTGADQLIQNILGSYDAALGINNNQLSGIAVVEAATQSNAAAMPYIVGYLQGIQRVAEIIVDLIPKYYVTPRTIPIINKNNERSYVKINTENPREGIEMDYDPNVLNVKVEAGVNFAVQKSRSIMMIKELMGMSPLMQQFFGEKGIPFILDNMEGRGIEMLKDEVKQFMQELQQQKQMQMQQMQQQMQQPNPQMMKAQIDMAKLQHEQEKTKNQFIIEMEKLQQEEKKTDAELTIAHEEANVDRLKANTERYGKEIDLRLQHGDLALKENNQLHSHRMDIHDKLREHEEKRNETEKTKNDIS